MNLSINRLLGHNLPEVACAAATVGGVRRASKLSPLLVRPEHRAPCRLRRVQTSSPLGIAPPEESRRALHDTRSGCELHLQIDVIKPLESSTCFNTESHNHRRTLFLILSGTLQHCRAPHLAHSQRQKSRLRFNCQSPLEWWLGCPDGMVLGDEGDSLVALDGWPLRLQFREDRNEQKNDDSRWWLNAVGRTLPRSCCDRQTTKWADLPTNLGPSSHLDVEDSLRVCLPRHRLHRCRIRRHVALFN